MMARWSDQARAAIARIHAAMPDGATPADRKRALRENYPFAARSGFAYKAWLREQKKYLARFPDVSKIKDSPLFRAARGLAEKKARPAMMSCRDSGWNAQGRFALFRCPRCKAEKVLQIENDNDKLAKPPCPKCNRERTDG